MRWRSIIILGLLATEGTIATAREAQPQLPETLVVDEPRVVVVNVPDRIVPTAVPMTPDVPPVDLDEVTWTVTDSAPLPMVAQLWGVSATRLREYNPGIDDVAVVQAGTTLAVFRTDPEAPTESVGSPHRGRLKNGIPLPEGPYWRLRDRRIRAWGAEGTIRSLVHAFNVYGQTHPDGPPIHVGELSARKGGRAWPHVSHRTGRDVDIGYVMKPGTLGERHWRSANEDTLDVEKTWTLIKAIGDTGRVQRIFISSKLQKLLKAHARTVDTPETVAQYFRTPGAGPKQRYLITHENGHRDHLHVRFRCDPEDRRCRGHGLFPIERAPAPEAAGSLTNAAP